MDIKVFDLTTDQNVKEANFVHESFEPTVTGCPDDWSRAWN